jgi:predicted RNA-binding protein with PIN domain
MFIALDGYNFIKQSPEFRRLEQVELQKAREGLIDQLARYKRLKGHSITVVFDGWQQGRLAGHRERSKGIEVIFSRVGEKADDVLKQLAAEKRDGVLIVTSDQEVASFAEKKGAQVISAAAFEGKMEMARFYDLKGGGAEEALPNRPVAPEKKGPSRRLSKSKRKAIAAAKKL